MSDDPRLPSREDFDKVAKATHDTLEKAFKQLTASAEIKGAEPRFFFPHGIELIDVEVKFNVKDGISVSLKLAGEKAPKLLESVREAAGQTD